MKIPIDLREEEAILFQRFAEQNCMTVPEMIRTVVLEHIENEFDKEAFEEAMELFRKEPISHSLEDVRKELNLV